MVMIMMMENVLAAINGKLPASSALFTLGSAKILTVEYNRHSYPESHRQYRQCCSYSSDLLM